MISINIRNHTYSFFAQETFKAISSTLASLLMPSACMICIANPTCEVEVLGVIVVWVLVGF